MEANLESLESLERNLEMQGYDLARLPFVIQYNKRDVSGALAIDELNATLNPGGRPVVEAVANRGEGVMETLQLISGLVVEELKGGGRT